MENGFLFISLCVVMIHIAYLTFPSNAQSSCNGPCQTLNDCSGQLICINECSPPVTSSTKANLTLNDFSKGGDGGAPSECDGQYHPKTELVVALSTGWYDRGSRCGKMIKITTSNGRIVRAKVVDECDSMSGCDEDHAWQPPCKNNIVDGSDAVWEALGLNKEDGVVDVTWSMT